LYSTDYYPPRYMNANGESTKYASEAVTIGVVQTSEGVPDLTGTLVEIDGRKYEAERVCSSSTDCTGNGFASTDPNCMFAEGVFGCLCEPGHRFDPATGRCVFTESNTTWYVITAVVLIVTVVALALVVRYRGNLWCNNVVGPILKNKASGQLGAGTLIPYEFTRGKLPSKDRNDQTISVKQISCPGVLPA